MWRRDALDLSNQGQGAIALATYNGNSLLLPSIKQSLNDLSA
jgi:hypothetical protein